MNVAEGVGVSVNVGKEEDMAVTVSITDVSIERMGVKFESGLATPRLHALSRNITVAMKNNKNTLFLIRMAASILE
jgi:hypothetical protein